MRGFGKGFNEVILGIVGGIIMTAFLNSFKEGGLIPTDIIWLFTLVGAAGSLGMLFMFKSAGFTFIAGWLLGAWILKDAMSKGDFLLYFWAPIAVVIIRIIFFFKKSSGGGGI